KWQVKAAISYDTGNYGTPDRTEAWYFPLTLQRLFEKGDLSVTVPFLSIRTSGQTTIVNGSPQRIPKTRTTTTTNGGLGDILMQGRFYLFESDKNWIPNLALMGKVKFPTASESKGLGTGEFDFGGGGEFSLSFLDDWVGYFDLGYTYIGGAGYRNQWLFSPGLGYHFTPKILGGIFYEERTAIVAGEPNPRSLLFSGLFAVTKRVRFNTMMEFGLSDGAPDYGFTLGGGFLF
ncbi:MAG: hypothetical protein Q7S68_05670, partial [Deltaproteobacteria bacterium]|nr:hypothetical protein [Deltaproteobacteria bacterium]